MRIGIGFDIHRLEDGIPLVLAGVSIDDSTKGPVAHSDGDVLCHALIDALLGAAALGDIGTHFPDTDDQWKGAAGLDLLARTHAILQEHSFTVGNIDAIIQLETPKLKDRKQTMAVNIAKVLQIETSQVNIKAGTNESLGPVGQHQAITAHTTATIIPA